MSVLSCKLAALRMRSRWFWRVPFRKMFTELYDDKQSTKEVSEFIGCVKRLCARRSIVRKCPSLVSQVAFLPFLSLFSSFIHFSFFFFLFRTVKAAFKHQLWSPSVCFRHFSDVTKQLVLPLGWVHTGVCACQYSRLCVKRLRDSS